MRFARGTNLFVNPFGPRRYHRLRIWLIFTLGIAPFDCLYKTNCDGIILLLDRQGHAEMGGDQSIVWELLVAC